MNTVFLLMAQHGKAVLPLAEVCKEYFALSSAVAERYAKAGRLPVPAYKAGASAKAPWLVNITDLAAFLDEQRNKALSDLVA